MNKPILSLLFLALMAFGDAPPARGQNDDPAALKRQVSLLEKQLEAARKETAALKAENAGLRRENAQMKRDLAVQPKLRALPGGDEKVKSAADGAYWITTSTGKRHNSSCRYFRGGNGRAGSPGEGEACKLCGG